MNVFEKLPRPYVALAPMADVTDAAFRRVVARIGHPDLLWTEFVSADGLLLADERGKEILQADLAFDESEHPVIAQLFTSVPAHMRAAAALAARMGFDGIDINMGCPDRAIEKQGCGAALIKNPARALELIEAARHGVADAGKPELPVSVKTRIGYRADETESWIGALLTARPAAITLHARTRAEMSKVPPHWETVARAVRLRDTISPETHILGNGDVASRAECVARAEETGCDGIMVGRAAIGNPWFFVDREPSLDERLDTMLEHARLFTELLPHKSFAVIRKHASKYLTSFAGARELRIEIMAATNYGELADAIVRFRSAHNLV